MSPYAAALDAPPTWTARSGYRRLAREAGIGTYVVPYAPSPIAALACETCSGEGVVAEKVCYHSGSCPCDWEEGECPMCGGTGEQPCASCEEGIAVGVDSSGDKCCTDCIAEDSTRTATEPAPGKVPSGPAEFGVRDCRMDTRPAETTGPEGARVGGSRGRRVAHREGTRAVEGSFKGGAK